MKLLIGVCGSVAAIKLPALLSQLQQQIENVELKVVCTNRSKFFLDETNSALKEICFFDEDEWKDWNNVGDPILHIQVLFLLIKLRNWADALLIAPLDANTLGKISCGICDNLLTCVLRAWDISKPVILCPAMNTLMWTHPITQSQIDILKSWNYKIILPITKILACGDEGIGAMESVQKIVENIKIEAEKIKQK